MIHNESINRSFSENYNPSDKPRSPIIKKNKGNSLMQKSTHITLNPSPKSVLTTKKPAEPKQTKTATAEINTKTTSPTLVEFQNKNAQLPEWRLQLKNAVQKRKGQNAEQTEMATPIHTRSDNRSTNYPTNGGNALKADVYEEAGPETIDNKQLANALKRIEQSRQKYYIVEPEKPIEAPIEEKPAKDFPFTIASRNENPLPVNDEEQNSSVNFPTKPKLVPASKTQIGDCLYDTSELDPEFIPAKIASSFARSLDINCNPDSDTETNNQPILESKVVLKSKDKVSAKTEIKAEVKVKETEQKAKIIVEKKAVETELVIDDVAPFSLRFNAGLFDLIIGSFSSMILLAPFVLLGGSWFTVAGLFAFLATCSIVMFIYLTTTVGLFGKTFGMHLFSLEMVDYQDDEYPTFHQAAVSSSIYLLSLVFFGLGFITTLFDEDKRAVHDLVSGTFIVKEM
jgi:uncharacterized RDD family membrane protein YckC